MNQSADYELKILTINSKNNIISECTDLIEGSDVVFYPFGFFGPVSHTTIDSADAQSCTLRLFHMIHICSPTQQGVTANGIMTRGLILSNCSSSYVRKAMNEIVPLQLINITSRHYDIQRYRIRMVPSASRS